MDSERPGPNSTTPSDPNRLLPEDTKIITFEFSKNEENVKKEQPVTSPSSSVTEESGSGNVAADDDNDGFRTPVNHRIPVITECPPAPKKTIMPLRKRKAHNSPRAACSRKRVQINLSQEEFDALFPPYDFRGEIIKKA